MYGILNITASIFLSESEFAWEIILFADLVWAEQGDEISLEYAGTNALKGDLVR